MFQICAKSEMVLNICKALYSEKGLTCTLRFMVLGKTERTCNNLQLALFWGLHRAFYRSWTSKPKLSVWQIFTGREISELETSHNFLAQVLSCYFNSYYLMMKASKWKKKTWWFWKSNKTWWCDELTKLENNKLLLREHLCQEQPYFFNKEFHKLVHIHFWKLSCFHIPRKEKKWSAKFSIEYVHNVGYIDSNVIE